MIISNPYRRAILSLLAITTIIFGQETPAILANCNPSHDHLDPSTHRFISSCPDEMYCSPFQNQTDPNTSLINEQQQVFFQGDSAQDQDSKQRPVPTLDHYLQSSGTSNTPPQSASGGTGHSVGGVCVPRACRRDEYPFGFPSVSALPPPCSSSYPSTPTSTAGSFCPDNGSGCRAVLPPGSTCELVRDEQCAVQPIGEFGKGLKEGALCLNQVCTYVNATFASSCVMENTTYTFPSATSHSLYTLSVIRHNCVTELYCEPASLTCVKAKENGESCNADFECVTSTCDQGTCVNSLDSLYEVTPRQWAILISVILIALITTMTALILIHRRHRYLRFRELREYYLEQISLRRAIITLHTSAAADSRPPLAGGSDSIFRKGCSREVVY